MDQRSDEWFAARLGIPTASEFGTVMAKGEGKTRRSYMYKLAGEIITGQPTEGYTNAHMERGKTLEDEARQLYSFMTDQQPIQVGFGRRGRAGCSPDSLVDDNGMVEIKTRLPHLMVETLLKGEMPPEHKAQVQGALWIFDREWLDFVAYFPRMPLFVTRVTRDNGYIANMAGEVSRFNDELDATVYAIRNYGQQVAA
jgi:hypothetical protein